MTISPILFFENSFSANLRLPLKRAKIGAGSRNNNPWKYQDLQTQAMKKALKEAKTAEVRGIAPLTPEISSTYGSSCPNCPEIRRDYDF